MFFLLCLLAMRCESDPAYAALRVSAVISCMAEDTHTQSTKREKDEMASDFYILRLSPEQPPTIHVHSQ